MTVYSIEQEQKIRLYGQLLPLKEFVDFARSIGVDPPDINTIFRERHGDLEYKFKAELDAAIKELEGGHRSHIIKMDNREFLIRLATGKF
jgi:hypothetical protein